VEPDAVEIRVAACMVEKQRTTPDQYPLTLHALRLACNQSTNREPVVDYDEATIRAALDRLGRRRWTTLASWSTARAVKYKHLLDQALDLDEAQLSLLAVLMLRGPQTPGELRQRTERMHRFDSGEDLERVLGQLVERELAEAQPRRPGERGRRFAHLLGSGSEAEAAPPERAAAEEAPAADAPAQPAPAAEAPSQPASAPEAPSQPGDGLVERVERLEQEVASLRGQLLALREELGD
jgi:uncharacterized protein YceH (UPF0502 family)